MSAKIVAALLFLSLIPETVLAQAPQQPLTPPNALTVNVVLFGHSWIYLMQGLQSWAFPNIPSRHIAVNGFPGYTCSGLLPITLANVPANTDEVFIMAATNDVAAGIPVDQHMECMRNMIGTLIGENPHMLIVLANVPPFGHAATQYFGDKRSAISTYNQAYAGLPQQYPNNVRLVDLWTPVVDTTGWGLTNMFADGIHPGANGIDLVMGTIRDGLYSALAH